MSQTLEREMGYTQKEFMRTLPKGLHGYDFTLVENGADIQLEGCTVSIRIGAEQIRKIALIQIPYIPVCFNYGGISDQVRQQLMKQFDLYFKKGGG